MAMPQVWDAIVVGSGIGGLAAATLLARVGKQRVLVLEKHSERGGLTHVFRRDGASWDVGVHYVGNMTKGARIRTLFDFMSGGALAWNQMPDDFERFVYPGGLDFAVPSNPTKYQERLVERFPGEAPAIKRYFADLAEVFNWYAVGTMQAVLPAPMSYLVQRYRKRGADKALQTTAEYLDGHFESTELKGLLASQWPDYGLPPKESAFVLHALVAWSYANGGWFPQGGSGRIARTFETGVEAAGGEVKVCHEVTSITTDKNGHVTGVKAIDRSGVEPTEVVFHSRTVVSNAGAHLTYRKLLPTDGEIGAKTAEVRGLVDRLGDGPSAVTLYLRLDKPVSTIGIKGENYWINTTFDHDDLEAQTAAVMDGKPQHVYMSFPSAKSGDDRFHTAEILSLVNGAGFSAWRETEHGMRGKEYLELKERIAAGLLDLAETATPGLKALVRYSELSTPLSVIDYTSRPAGAIYGLRGRPERYSSTALLYQPSPVHGLYISGGDAANLGVAGALMGGVVAASRVLGPLGFFKIMKAAGAPQPPPPTAKTGTDVLPADAAGLRSPGKKRCVLLSKAAVAPSVWRLEFELDEPIRSHAPGQFAMLRVAPFEWRSYSIASAEGRVLTLLVSTRTGGDGSAFADAVAKGGETQVELPFGSFRLRRNANRKVFVATGTGLAPFLPMFGVLAKEERAELGLDKAELLFGCRLGTEDITKLVTSPLPKTIVCVSGDEAAAKAEGRFQGRVTKALEELQFDAKTTDFYLCGSPAMVNNCQMILARAGVSAEQIFIEPY